VLTRVIQFMELMGLRIQLDIFFLVSDPLIFLIFFLFHSSILDWLRNEVYDLFIFTFYRVITISNKYIFLKVGSRF
jgi:hypothetical protein